MNTVHLVKSNSNNGDSNENEVTGSFRSYSRSVRSFRPGSFRPDFRGESFRPNWGGSFRPNFKGGSFRSHFRGESFRSDLFILGKRKGIRLSSP